MTCYTGKDLNNWNKHVKLIDYFHVQLFPIILTKGSDEQWIGVTELFPHIYARSDEYNADDEKLLIVTKECFETYKFIENTLINDEIQRDVGTRDELSSLIMFDQTRKFIHILKQRLLTDESHKMLKQEMVQVLHVGFKNSIQLKRLKYESAKDVKVKDEIKQELMTAYEKFENAEEKVDSHMDDFYTKSKECSRIENKEFNLGFNENYFLNYNVYMKTCKLHGMDFQTYKMTQKELWSDLLKALTDQKCSIEPNEKSFEVKPRKNILQTKRYKQKVDLYSKMKQYIDQNIREMNLIDLKISLKDIQNQNSDFQEMYLDPDIQETDDKKYEILESSKALIRTISTQIEIKQEEKREMEELKKQEINTNLKSLGTVKLCSLTGFEDYLAWKKSQNCLNSHTDPFKKGATLLGTLKNEQDIARCQGIFDFDSLMSILEQKYSKQEKLIPAMVNKLRKLPEAYDQNTMLKNIGNILNIYSQLAEMSETAINRFDSTLVEDLVLKLDYKTQVNWEEHVLDNIDAMNDQKESSLRDNMSITSAESRQGWCASVDNEIEESKQKRNLFITFLKKKETILQNLRARKTVVGNGPATAKKRCKVCKNEMQSCSCKMKSKHLNYKVDAEITQNCPCCNSQKLHLNKKMKPSKSLNFCPKFKQANLEKRQEMAKNFKACFICLNRESHTMQDCFIKDNCKNCNKGRHHFLLCRDNKKSTFPNKSQYTKNKLDHDKIYKIKEEPETEVEVHTVQSDGSDSILGVSTGKIYDNYAQKFKDINALWDTASTSHFIKNEVAKNFGYKGYPVLVNIARLGLSPEHLKCYKYFITLKDRNGNLLKIEALGVPRIGEKRKISNKIFEHLAYEFNVPSSSIENVNGEISLLLGLGNFSIFPKATHTNAKYPNLGLMESVLGRPYLFVGSIGTNVDKNISCNFVDVHNKNYWLGDQLGLNHTPKCSVCLKAPPCKQCKLLTMPITFKEQEEAKIIRNSMTFDYKNKEVRVTYPYLKNMTEIFPPEKSNRSLAAKMALNLKRSLEKDGLLKEYTKSFLEMQDRGAIRELSDEECKQWEDSGNPINYCSHHGVLKESSATTKFRSVCNSSLSHSGTSLNACLAKGPTALSNLLHVILRFRAKPYVVISDLTKAYNSMRTSPLECHLRRLLWFKESDLEKENPKLKTFGMTSIAFGDTPASFYLECAKEEVVNYVKNILKNEKLANDLLASSYVDDIAPSLDSLEEAKKYEIDLPKAFETIGFTIKDIFVGGQNIKPNKLPENKNLFGHLYNIETDKIEMKFTVNFSKKKRSQRVSPNLTTESDLTNYKFTKRMMMSLLASQYDPLGLTSCFLAKYKIFLAQLFKKSYEWDTQLDQGDQAIALKLVVEMIHASNSNISFNRANRPKEYKISKLVCFVDASTVALQVSLYGIYVSKSGDLHTSLLTAKNRVANFTVPRNELNAIVAGHRLVLNFLEAVEEANLVEEICFLSDSTCSLDMLSQKYRTKEIFVINRISEIKRSAKKMNTSVKYYWINSKINVADKGTRDDCDLEFLSSDLWQSGPEFLKDLSSSQAELRFVINKDDNFNDKTNEIFNAATSTKPVQNKTSIWNDLLYRTNDLKKVLRIFCRVRLAIRNKSFRKQKHPSLQDMSQAFLFFIKLAQKETPIENLKVKQLVTFTDNEVTFTQMRFPTSMMTNIFGKDKLPVISGKTRFGKLLLMNAHCQKEIGMLNPMHNGIRQTLVNSRIGTFGTYITHGKQNIRALINNCTVCRRSEKVIQNAQMDKNKGGFGEIPADGSIFNKIAMDYFGPFYCKPPKLRETRVSKKYKVYGMIILCQQTRAVKIIPVEGYDQESFLTAFKIHCSNHGIPTEILSDPMSSFIASSKTIGKQIEEIESEIDNTNTFKPRKQKSNFEETLQHAYNINWNFILPGSQWRDPAEASVKCVKRLMYSSFNTEHNKPTLTLNEYWCIFAEISELLNRRPIQGIIEEDTIQFICPNQLILGRSSKDQPIELPKEMESKPRLELLDSIKKEFWKSLMNVLASDSHLMKYPGWYKQSRKPAEGDVVLLLYKSKLQDNYRIGLIDKVSEDGKNLELYVSPVQDSSIKSFKNVRKMKVPTQRTVLLYSPKND